jgi:negative regulator of flagellin synthesis FlgM
MQQLAEQVSAAGSIDYDKVSAVKQALANGSYRINPEAIADSLVGLEKGLSR